MKSTLKKVLTLMCLVCCLNFLSLTVEAAGPRDGEIVDGSLLTSNQTASDSFEINTRSMILASGLSSITHHGRGVLYLSGETYGYQVCNKLKANIFLERLVGDSWQYVTQRSYTAEDSYKLIDGVYVTLPTGYYYRIQGNHAAIKGNLTETNYTLTDGIYIE